MGILAYLLEQQNLSETSRTVSGTPQNYEDRLKANKKGAQTLPLTI
jgi:hypothetical protein